MMSNPLVVEVVQRQYSAASKEYVTELVVEFLNKSSSLRPGACLSGRALQGGELAEHVEAVVLCDLEHAQDVAPRSVPLRVLVHSLDERGAETEEGEGEGAACVTALALPARELHGLWESLVFDDSLKRDTVRLVESALEFGARGVDPLLVGWNRVLLLHGPPGTGKTSLCRALAHKLAVRLAERFPRARLLEVDAHGLFSKWFAESGKQVAGLFARVQDAAADPRLLLCVLLDEVESLAHARRAALAGCEPSDAVRAVNALLTQLDRLRRLPNVLVLTTSNVTGAIDVALADRADMKRRVGPPSAGAAAHILRGCCAELAARGAVRGEPGARLEAALRAVAERAAAARVSARALRRLPLLAHALHAPRDPDAAAFVRALSAALDQHLLDDATFRASEPL